MLKSLEQRDWSLKRDYKKRCREFYEKNPDKLLEDIFSMVRRNVEVPVPKSYRGKDEVRVVRRIKLD